MKNFKRSTEVEAETELKKSQYLSQLNMSNAFNINHNFKNGFGMLPNEMSFNNNIISKKAMLLTCPNVDANHVNQNMRFRKNPIIPEMMVKPAITKRGSRSTDCFSLTATFKDLNVFSQDLIDQLLVYLKCLLKNEKLFKIKEATKDIVPGTLLEEEIFEIAFKTVSSKDCIQDIISLCTSTKELSLNFQNYLSDCTEEETRIIGQKLSNHYPELITHKYANYVLQRLVAKDQYTLKALSSYCQANFIELTHNEYSSRVIQALIEASICFRRFAINKFKSDITLCMGKITAVYLLIACIKNTTDLREVRFIVDSLSHNQGLMSCKLYQRALVTYVQHCTAEDLEEVCRVMKMKRNFRSFLNNKFTSYVILTMLQRGQQSVVEYLLNLMVFRIETLFETRFFKLLLSKLWEQKSGAALAQIISTLTNLHPEKVKQLKSKESYFYFYIFITISSFNSSQLKETAVFLSRPDMIWEISDLMTRMKTNSQEDHSVSINRLLN